MTVTIKDGRDAVYQGDIDRYLQLINYAPATKVSFANSKSLNTFDLAIKDDGTVPIPNELLSGAYEGNIAIYIGTEEYTLWEGNLTILHRQLPADYVLEPTKVRTWSEILAEMQELKTSASDSVAEATAIEQRVNEKCEEIKQIAGTQGPKGDTGEKGEKGDRGDAFSISKVYNSVSEMNAGYATDNVPVGGFVVIDTGNVEDADNAKLYVKGNSQYDYLTDMSGATGIQGPRGDKGDTGETGAQGIQGEAGKTPVRGTDYWTDADKTEIVNNVLSQIENFSVEVF